MDIPENSVLCETSQAQKEKTLHFLICIIKKSSNVKTPASEVEAYISQLYLLKTKKFLFVNSIHF